MSLLKKFYDTFGYVILRNAYDKNLIPGLQAAYDRTVASHFGQSIEDFLAKPRPMIGGMEVSQELLNFVQNSRILPAVEELLGDDAIFWGSDLSTFVAGSKFHRDAWGDYKLLKVGVYLQDTTEQDGGQFCCIPGTHLY